MKAGDGDGSQNTFATTTQKYTEEQQYNMAARYIRNFRCNNVPDWTPTPEQEEAAQKIKDAANPKDRKYFNFQMGVHPFHPCHRKIAQQIRKEVSDHLFASCDGVRLEEKQFKDYDFEFRLRIVRKIHYYMNPRLGWSRNFSELVLKTINEDNRSNLNKDIKKQRKAGKTAIENVNKKADKEKIADNQTLRKAKLQKLLLSSTGPKKKKIQAQLRALEEECGEGSSEVDVDLEESEDEEEAPPSKPKQSKSKLGKFFCFHNNKD